MTAVDAPTVEAAAHARQAALETSGWGNRVEWWQPRNAALWVFVLACGYGVVEMIGVLRPTLGTSAGALGISALIFAVYGAVFWWFTTVIDRYSPQPASLRVAAFAWGALAATWVIAVHANNALHSIYLKVLGQQTADAWWAPLSAPFTEELAKGAGVLLLLFIAPTVIRTAYDGFVIGAFAGLGFQILENVLYAVNQSQREFASDPIGNALSNVGLRMLSGFTSHILYSALFGAGLIYLIGTRAQRRRPLLGVGLCLLAMTLHFLWDGVSALSGGSGPLSLVLIALIFATALVCVVLVFRLTVRDERATMRAVMAPEVLDGTLSTAELDALAGARRDRHSYRRRATDRDDRRHRALRLAAAHDLAEAVAADRRGDGTRAAFARAELARVGEPAR